MFSANENLMLREHKRRVVNHVEATIPEEALDMGTTVMVMQTQCRTPGCVPLETAIAIVFPRLKGKLYENKEWIPNLKESVGGTYKTKVLLPLSEVTKDDVLDALPPQFTGGRKTWERTCLQVRDLVFGRIGGILGDGDTDIEVEERTLLAQYLRESLDDYLARGCKAPELNMPFDKLTIRGDETEGEDSGEDNNGGSGKVVQVGGDENDESGKEIPAAASSDTETTGTTATSTTPTSASANVISGTMGGSKNFTIRRALDDDDEEEKALSSSSSRQLTRTLTTSTFSTKKSAMEWRTRTGINTLSRNNMTKERKSQLSPASASASASASDRMLQQLSQREHAPGIRRPGCPCCEPDQYEAMMQNL